MNSPHSKDLLSSALADWRVEPARNPAFRTDVWARIGRSRHGASWSTYARAHAGLLAGAMAVALVLGGMAGREKARTQVEAERAEMVSAYVRSLDARAMQMP